jgi:hypothetical protein
VASSVYQLPCTFTSAGAHELEVESDSASLAAIRFHVVDTSARDADERNDPVA